MCEHCEKIGFEFCQCKPKVQRTGNIYSFASSEYLVTFPDHTTETIWSPPWHEMDRAEEDRQAAIYAQELWQQRLATDKKQSNNRKDE